MSTPPSHWLPRRRLASALMLAVGGSILAPSWAAEPLRREWPAGLATPGLTAPTLDGRAWSLAERRGRVVLLNFWASWCEPCRDELPSMQALAQQEAARGLEVLAVNFKESEATIRHFAERSGLSLPVVRDADGALARAWGVRVFPSTLAVGRDGRARFAVVGEIDWGAATARRWIADLF